MLRAALAVSLLASPVAAAVEGKLGETAASGRMVPALGADSLLGVGSLGSVPTVLTELEDGTQRTVPVVELDLQGTVRPAEVQATASEAEVPALDGQEQPAAHPSGTPVATGPPKEPAPHGPPGPPAEGEPETPSARVSAVAVVVERRLVSGGAAGQSAGYDNGAPHLAPEEIRLVLGDGPGDWRPFRFSQPSGPWEEASGAGLVGFLRAKIRQRHRLGRAHTLGQLDDYFTYVGGLLARSGWEPERARLEAIRRSDALPGDKDKRLDEFLLDLVARHGLQERLAGEPGSEEGLESRGRIRQVLGDGPPRWDPFRFAGPGRGPWQEAPNPGLEGFVWEVIHQQRRWGRAHMAGQLDSYFKYLDELLASAGWESERAQLEALRLSEDGPEEKTRRLEQHALSLANRLRARLQRLDPSLERRGEAAYMVLARSYAKLEPGRTIFDALTDRELLRIKYQPLDEQELDRIVGMSPREREEQLTPVFDMLWMLDIFEIGESNRWREQGSPYAINAYRVKKEHGGDEALHALKRRLSALGMNLMVDFIPNHYSLNSDLFKQHPDAFLHLVPPQPDLGEDMELYKKRILDQAPKDAWGHPMHHLVEAENYPEGEGRVRKWILVQHPVDGSIKWIDMAQIDYSHPAARAWQINEARRLFLPIEQGGFGVDGIRRDMSYYQANGRYFAHWLNVMRGMLGKAEWENAAPWVRAALVAQIQGFERRSAEIKTEILAEIDAAIRKINPKAVVYDEVYGQHRSVSRSGSSGLYNKTDLYDALVSHDPERIRWALRRLAFALWQRGAAALVQFAATHDAGEGNPVDKFPGLLYPLLVNTLLLRPTLFYNGTELMVGRDEMLERAKIPGKEEFEPSEDDRNPEKKMISFDARMWIKWSGGHPERRRFLRRLLEAGARNRDLFRRGVMEVLEPMSEERSITAWTAGVTDPGTGVQRALLVAANWLPAPGGEKRWARFRFDGTGLSALGAFVPRADRRYVLTDLAHLGEDGNPMRYERTGEDMLAGITIGLERGDVHIIEVAELPAGG